MGKKTVAWTDQAKADLRAIDQPTALRILHAIARYLASGEGDVKRLQDVKPPELRLRLGDYRVRFHDLGDSIRVLAVKHRSEAYR
jgi:mRNA interferase RelE/StbE